MKKPPFSLELPPAFTEFRSSLGSGSHLPSAIREPSHASGVASRSSLTVGDESGPLGRRHSLATEDIANRIKIVGNPSAATGPIIANLSDSAPTLAESMVLAKPTTKGPAPMPNSATSNIDNAVAVALSRAGVTLCMTARIGPVPQLLINEKMKFNTNEAVSDGARRNPKPGMMENP